MSTGAITSVQANGGYCFNYETHEDYVSIESSGDCEGELIIPSIIESLPVTQISAYSFDNSSVTALTIPSTVSDISNDAFTENRFIKSFAVSGDYYSTLNGVLYDFDKTLLIAYPAAKANHSFSTPVTVIEITETAFNYAQHLRELTLNEGLRKLGNYAFAEAEHLAILNIPSTLNTMPVNLFYGVETMKTIKVSPASSTLKTVDGVLLTKNGKVLIAYPPKMEGTLYAVPAGVELIDVNSFAYNKHLQSVTLPPSLVSIGSGAFREAKALTSISIPASVTWISSAAFLRVSTLTNVTIPSGSELEFIDSEAFAGTGITSFEFPAKVWEFSRDSFEATKITSFSVSPENDSFVAVDGVVLTKSLNALVVYPAGRIGSYSVPNTVSEIPFKFFAFAEGLTSVDVPASVTHIHDSAFLSSGLTAIDFEGNSQLSYISSFAFASTKLTSIFIPTSVNTIGSQVFQGTALNSIGVNPDNTHFESVDGVLFDENISYLIRYPSNKMNTTYSIPETVLNVVEDAFGGAKNLETLEVPAATTYISGEALLGAESLKSISVDPDNLDYSSDDGVLFNAGRTALFLYPAEKAGTEYSVPSSIRTLAGNTFADAKNLETLNLPQSTNQIWGAGFDLNQSIKTFNVSANNAVLASVDGVIFSKDLTEILAYPPARTGPYIIPSSVLTVDDDAFNRNSKVSELTVPGSVELIGSNAFRDLTELTKITFKASAVGQSFYRNVFYGSKKLAVVIFEGKAPALMQARAFESQPSVTIYYPINEPTWTLAKITTPFSSYTMIAGGISVKYAPTSAATTKASIKGVAKIGKSVTAVKGKFTGSPTITYKYQWFKCSTKAGAAVVATKTPAKCVAIAKATYNSFKVTKAQKGSYARVRITAKNSTSSVTVFSASTAKIS
jgi:hypothetical protein